jgi:transposase
LADVTELLQQNNQFLQENNQFLQEQLKIQQQTNENLQNEVSLLREQISELTRKLFGRSKETLPDETNGQLSLFDDPSEKQPQPVPEEIEVKAHTKRKSQGKKQQGLEQFPVKACHHELSETERICDKCGELMADIGDVIVRQEIEFLQAKLETLQHHQHSYSCKNCERHGKTSMKKAPVPKSIISNSIATPSLLTETIIQKYQQKVPAYRQEKYWRGLKLDLNRDKIINWHLVCVRNALKPLAKLLQEHLTQQSVIHADETTYRVIESAKEKSYYWLYVSSELAEKQIVLYDFNESRSADVPTTFLKGFSGTIHCDGYSAYGLIPNVQLMHCGAHVRRKFYDAIANKKDPDRTSPAYIGADFWDQMFKVERSLKNLPSQERKQARQEQLKPILDAFWEWLETVNPLAKSKLAMAVNYASKHRDDINRILTDGELELSNNRAERMVKELVMGRKNWLFSTSIEGAEAAGILLSVMKTAELNGLDVRKYFELIFSEIPNLAVQNDASLERLLPWSPEVTATCMIQK